MSGLFTYSGIVTKTRAMERELLTLSDYYRLAECATVTQALDFLMATKGYEKAFGRIAGSRIIHRDMIESCLDNSLYAAYVRLYRFATAAQRAFLHLRFMRYETEMLKRVVRQIKNRRPVEFDFGDYDDFFDKHTDFRFEDLMAATSMSDFTEALSRSMYYPAIRHLEPETASVFDYETALDLFYFQYIWKKRTLKLSKKEREMVTENWGATIDTLNLSWIYRCKKFFHLKPAEIYPLIIPIEYRLRKKDLIALVESPSLDAFIDLTGHTPYARYLADREKDTDPFAHDQSFSTLSERVLDEIYVRHHKDSPYSIATLNDFLRKKEHEIKVLIPIIEGIRYQLPHAEIVQRITNEEAGT